MQFASFAEETVLFGATAVEMDEEAMRHIALPWMRSCHPTLRSTSRSVKSTS